MKSAVFSVSLDGWDEEQPGNNVPDANGAEGETYLNGVEVVLLVDKREGLDEHEHQGIGKARQKRQDQNDGLSDEHPERPEPGYDDFLSVETFSSGSNFVGSPDVHARVLLPSLLRNLVHHDGGSGLRDEDEMGKLDSASEDQLDPYTPTPGKPPLGEAADDWTEDGAAD